MDHDEFIRNFLKLKPRRVIANGFVLEYKNYTIVINNFMDKPGTFFYKVLGDDDKYFEISEDTYWLVKDYYWNGADSEEFHKDVINDIRKLKLEELDENN